MRILSVRLPTCLFEEAQGQEDGQRPGFGKYLGDSGPVSGATWQPGTAVSTRNSVVLPLPASPNDCQVLGRLQGLGPRLRLLAGVDLYLLRVCRLAGGHACVLFLAQRIEQQRDVDAPFA